MKTNCAQHHCRTWPALAMIAVLVPGCGRSTPVPPPAPSVETPPRAPGDFEVAEVVFEGKLGAGWEDWGWGQHELAEGQPVRINLSGFGGIILHHETLPPKFGGVSFKYLAPESFGEFLQVSLQYRQVDETSLPPVFIEKKYIASLPGGWKEVLVPWAALNPSGSPFDRIQIHARKQVAADLVSLDRVVLTKPIPGSAAPTAPGTPVKLSIDCSRQATKINPLIYSVAADPWLTDSPARRLGGNTSSRLNWELGNVWNTGSDWFFENVAGSKTKLGDWIQADVDHGAKTILTVPMIGWVAKDDSSVGFPVSKFGPQRGHDQYRQEAGDGYTPDGKLIKPGPPSQTSIPAPPELIEKWIAKLREADKARGKRGVDGYILDNEPNLWHGTHRDIHPEHMTYDELLDRTIKYGTAIRKADPEATIQGPAEWGWSAYFFSAKDLAGGLVPHADQLAHGGTPLLPWYLGKLRDHEKKTGTRLIDIVDVHYYPQADKVWSNGGATDPETAALRLRSTRSLWDPTYHDESWIKDTVNLIPRLKEWIAENYPGRGISIGEWNFGAEGHISGGLAVAEVLGRFGQQGITSAYYWVGPPPGSPAATAFRAFRNYDGKGARFLDWSIPTDATNNVSLFASRDDGGGKVTAVILNLDPEKPIQADLDVSRCGSVQSKRTFAYGEGDGGLTERKAAPGPGVSEHLAPYSMAVIELTVTK